MVRGVAVLMAVSSLVLASQTMAAQPTAQLGKIAGDVKVSQNGKIATAKPGALKAGDRVIAGKGGATLIYADGCVVTLKAQSMATISTASPCASGQGLVSAGAASAQSSYTTTQIVVGAIAVGAFLYGVGSILSNDHDGTGRPVSP